MNIDDVDAKDSGRYTVVIRNTAGEDSFTAKLNVDDGMYHCFKLFIDFYCSLFKLIFFSLKEIYKQIFFISEYIISKLSKKHKIINMNT